MSKEQMPDMQPNNPPEIPRRDFVKKMGAGAIGGVLFGDQITDIGVEKQSRKENVKQQIEKCSQIIQNEQYEQILENPYLVYALYYSEQAIGKIKPPYEYASEEIIGNIYPLITKQFRENYLNFLQNFIEEENTRTEAVNLESQSLPLDSINWEGAQYNHPDAIDLFIEENLSIHSMSSGIVVLAENGWTKENEFSTSSIRGGNTVIVFNLKDKSFYRYAHMKEASISVGVVLSAGEVIGKVGHTGITASQEGHGEHLHLEINKYDEEKGVMIVTPVSELQEKLRALQG